MTHFFKVWKAMEHLVVESTLLWLSWVDSIDSNSFELVDKSYSFVSVCCLCLTLVIVVISLRKFMAKFWFPGRIQCNKSIDVQFFLVCWKIWYTCAMTSRNLITILLVVPNSGCWNEINFRLFWNYFFHIYNSS